MEILKETKFITTTKKSMEKILPIWILPHCLKHYNATEWADLFVKSGARYAVLTTKHHDGFALWDSKEASFHHRRPWNSMEIGAHRNLVEEFVKAIRKTPLKVGCYFSLREWNNPFYTTSTMPIYVEQHLYPQ